MIVELCGAPAAGKTTTARLLAAGLRERGHEVELILSHRPREAAADVGQVAAGMRRLTRPVMETLAVICPFRAEGGDRLAAELVRLLPPRSLFWSVRLRQYLLRLLCSWQRAALARHIVMFDQAFVQALASLVILAKAEDCARMVRAFHRIPKSDLVVRIDAPAELLEARLRKRGERQPRFERLLELDLPTNLRFAPAIEKVCALFDEQVAEIVSIRSGDPVSRADALARIERTMADTRPMASDGGDPRANAR